MTDMPFEDPATMAGVDYTALNRSLLMFEVLGVEEIHTVHSALGERDPAIRANLTVVDGPEAGTHLADVLIFPKVLVGQLRPKVGKLVLGRLVQGVARPGLNAPWTLDAATAQDRQAAAMALARLKVGASETVARPMSSASEPPF